MSYLLDLQQQEPADNDTRGMSTISNWTCWSKWSLWLC